MRGFRDHVWKRSSRQVLDTDLLAVQPLDRSDVGIPDSSDCHLPLPSLGLERDRHELDAEHFGDRSGLRRKRTARLEGEDRAQCLTLRRVGALVDENAPRQLPFAMWLGEKFILTTFNPSSVTSPFRPDTTW